MPSDPRVPIHAAARPPPLPPELTPTHQPADPDPQPDPAPRPTHKDSGSPFSDLSQASSPAPSGAVADGDGRLSASSQPQIRPPHGPDPTNRTSPSPIHTVSAPVLSTAPSGDGAVAITGPIDAGSRYDAHASTAMILEMQGPFDTAGSTNLYHRQHVLPSSAMIVSQSTGVVSRERHSKRYRTDGEVFGVEKDFEEPEAGQRAATPMDTTTRTWRDTLMHATGHDEGSICDQAAKPRRLLIFGEVVGLERRVLIPGLVSDDKDSRNGWHPPSPLGNHQVGYSIWAPPPVII